MGGVEDDLGGATQSVTRGGRNNGNGTVLEHKLSLLKFVKCVLQQFPFARLSCHKHQHDLGACGKDCGIIVNHNSTELLLACLNSVTHHFDDDLVDGVHLGIELDSGHSITAANHCARSILAN